MIRNKRLHLFNVRQSEKHVVKVVHEIHQSKRPKSKLPDSAWCYDPFMKTYFYVSDSADFSSLEKADEWVLEWVDHLSTLNVDHTVTYLPKLGNGQKNV